MGIRESLLNTITSVADSDFVRIVTSAGASSKATVRNLFKSFESALGAKSSLTTSDYIRVVGSDNESYKQSVSAVKTAMGIDTLRAEVDALNSKTTDTITVASGWTVANNWCAKRAGITTFYLEVTNGTLSSGWNTLGTLPVGYRPANAFDIVFVDNGTSSAPAVQGKVTSAGLIQIYKSSGTTNNLRAYATFIV